MPGDGEDRWYSPEDHWPRHSKPWFRKALDHARSRGWMLKELSNHSFCWVYCRRSDDGDHCRYQVFSSGRSGEAGARELRQRVDRCPHRSSPSGKGDTVEDLVDKAELLVLAAAALIDASRHADRAIELWAAATELLDEAEGRTDDVSRLMADADDEEREAEAARTDSDELLEGTGIPPGVAPPALLDAAERSATSASTVLRKEPPSPWVKEFRLRVHAVRQRIGELRDQLESNRMENESFDGK